MGARGLSEESGDAPLPGPEFERCPEISSPSVALVLIRPFRCNLLLVLFLTPRSRFAFGARTGLPEGADPVGVGGGLERSIVLLIGSITPFTHRSVLIRYSILWIRSAVVSTPV